MDLVRNQHIHPTQVKPASMGGSRRTRRTRKNCSPSRISSFPKKHQRSCFCYLQDLNYSDDTVGNIAQILDAAQQTLFYNGQVVSPTQKFEYDALYRLTKTTGREHVSMGSDTEPELEGYNPAQISPENGQAMRNYTREWNYDGVGNILSLIHNANSNVNSWTRSYAYATNCNQLNTTTVGQSAVSYAHNEHGSMVSMPHLQAMEWDFAEHLSHITRGTTEAYYNYDGSGQRVRKVIEKGGITETRLYLGGFEIYRKKTGTTLNLERESLHVMDDKKRVALVETLTTNNGTLVVNPVSTLRYQLDNHLGSASLELDDTASIISYEEYYPYGDTSYQAGRSASEVSEKRYRYTGKEKDEESGLYYHGARYYACWLGRWTASDPAGLVDGVNLFAYVRGNPVRLNDPSGHKGQDANYTLPEQHIKGDATTNAKATETLSSSRGRSGGYIESESETETEKSPGDNKIRSVHGTSKGYGSEDRPKTLLIGKYGVAGSSRAPTIKELTKNPGFIKTMNETNRKAVDSEHEWAFVIRKIESGYEWSNPFKAGKQRRVTQAKYEVKLDPQFAGLYHAHYEIGSSIQGPSEGDIGFANVNKKTLLTWENGTLYINKPGDELSQREQKNKDFADPKFFTKHLILRSLPVPNK